MMVGASGEQKARAVEMENVAKKCEGFSVSELVSQWASKIDANQYCH